MSALSTWWWPQAAPGAGTVPVPWHPMERDSTLQVREPFADIPAVIKDLSRGRTTWKEVLDKYPRFEQQEASK